MNEGYHLSGFREKPIAEYLVSMGVYKASRRIMDITPEGRSYGFDVLMLTCLLRVTSYREGIWQLLAGYRQSR